MRPYRGIPIGGTEFVYGWLFIPTGSIRTYIITGHLESNIPVIKRVEVIPETVGQSTGLKDKNGVDLDWWEGDVFEIHGRKTLFRITEEGGCYWFRSDITKERFPCYQAIEWAKLPCKLGDSDTIFEDTTPGHKEAE